MAVTASQWKRLSPLLDAALDLPPGERAAWLAELPVEHADLRESLGELLAGGRAIETGDFLDRLPEFRVDAPDMEFKPLGHSPAKEKFHVLKPVAPYKG
jgi:hypothetical protein